MVCVLFVGSGEVGMTLLAGYQKQNPQPCVVDGVSGECVAVLDARAARSTNVVSAVVQWWWTNWARFAQGRLEK